ncbi:MAG: hypothetical protein WAL22_12990 [Solirubrobacteraceae bacterium]
MPRTGAMLQATMAKQPKPRWWTIRPAQNRKPSTYRCPLCGNQLPSLQAHMLITPEGDSSRRRHAHSACVMAARKQGRLPTEAEWRKARRAAERAAERASAGDGNGDGDGDGTRSIWARLRTLGRRDR